MKRLLCLFMCAVLVLGSLSGCGNSEAEPAPVTEPETVLTTEPATDCNRLVDVSGKEARAAVLAEGTLELASQLPYAAWNSLPEWNGVTVPNMQQYECIYDGEPQAFRREDMEKYRN